eukprot:TRINITY_DN18407_c0_g1_i1.p1 TRINITY_DN18407_c0_g1~~TRINITY_DN18407_c0_g1_i1.p1  ORF type:complete len:183 (+),score=53.48 TRINITY_DN18407_c0_g1_i1:45-593(+)
MGFIIIPLHTTTPRHTACRQGLPWHGGGMEGGGRTADMMFRFEVGQKELEMTPSRRDGISAEVEREQRAFCAELMTETCVLLSLPMICAARSIVLMQRLYFRVSLQDLSVLDVAPAMVFLASKLEEHDRRMRFIISAYQRVLLRRAGHKCAPLQLPQIEFSSESYFAVRVCPSIYAVILYLV